jgi:hypothetical protein
VSSQCKGARNTNTNINTNTNTNSNGDFMSSYLNSMLNQERKGKAFKAVASRTLPNGPAQQEVVDEVETPVEDASAPEPEQDESAAIPAAQLKFFQSLMAAKAQEFEE